MRKPCTLSGLLLALMTHLTLGASAQTAPDKGYLCFTANTAGSKAELDVVGTPADVTLQTSTDDTSWNDYTIATTITLANVSDKVYFRNAADIVTSFFL